MSCAPSCSGISRAMLAWQLSVGFCFAALLFCAVAFIARPANASDGYTIGAGGTTTINVYGVCRNVHNNNGSYSMYVATNSSGEWSNFVANPQNASLSTCVTPGSQTWSSAGTYSFTVPAYNNLTIQVWGGGGGGGWNAGIGNAGGSSWVSGYISASGGGAGSYTSNSAGGSGAGGTTNLTGGSGALNTMTAGAGANGGTGGAYSGIACGAGNAPGGGSAGVHAGGSLFPSGGGGGGYSSITYSAGQITVGTVLSLTVGSGGACAYNNYPGASGQVIISWN